MRHIFDMVILIILYYGVVGLYLQLVQFLNGALQRRVDHNNYMLYLNSINVFLIFSHLISLKFRPTIDYRYAYFASI